MTSASDFFDPLGRIREWASEIRQGNFAARVPLAQADEFAGLVDDVNRLAEWLESLANDAEEQLKLQAERLAAKSQSLQLLYDASALTSQAPGNEELIGQYLESLHNILDARYARGYLLFDNGMQLVSVVGKSTPAAAAGKQDSVQPGPDMDEEKLEKIVVPLKYKDRILGKYELYFEKSDEPQTPEIFELLPSIGRHLGMAIEKTRLEQEALEFSTMQERAQVANELHDSLAQTLAGLKFQVRVLDSTIAEGEDSLIWPQMERVESGLEEATLELRDLIAQFRGPVKEMGMIKTIDNVITQFKRGSDIEVVFHNHWGSTELPAEWERQIARVIQEALANAQKHSGATTVRVLLRCEDDGMLEAIVEDDGVGFDQPATSSHPGEHIGHTIMHERADQLGGDLVIDSEPGEGTRISLRVNLSGKTNPAADLVGTA